MRRRDVLRGSAALAGTLALAGGPQIPAFAQASTTLKVSDVHPPGYPTVAAVESLGKKLRTGDQRPAHRTGLRFDAARR